MSEILCRYKKYPPAAVMLALDDKQLSVGHGLAVYLVILGDVFDLFLRELFIIRMLFFLTQAA